MPGQVIDGETVPSGGMEGGDWRTQLQQDSRQWIVNKIMEKMKRHLLFSVHEGVLQEFKKIAVRFEEKSYTAATSQISLKLLAMVKKSQNPLRANAASNIRNPQDPASQSMQTQVQQLPIPMVSNQSQVWQQILSQNIQNNIPSTGVSNSAGLASALAPGGGMSQGTMANVPVQNANKCFLKSARTLSGDIPGLAARRLAPETRETPQKRAPEISPPNSKGYALGQEVHQGSNGIAARKRMAGMSEDSRNGRKQKISTEAYLLHHLAGIVV